MMMLRYLIEVILVFCVFILAKPWYCTKAMALRPKEFYYSLPRVDFALANAAKTDVIYKLYNSNISGKMLTLENVADEKLDRNIPLILLMHGWLTNDTSPWYGPLRDAYFKLSPHNVIYLNWSKAGAQSYQVSSANTKPVGKFIAEFLIASGVPPKRIQLIGHSLGSQLSSYIGKYMYRKTGKKIGRITALDPAGPMFNNPTMEQDERLCYEDADFVDVVHTDIEFSGFSSPMGHVDFYPNGGKHQPGCPSREKDDNCSHARATQYFIESLSTQVKAQEAIYTEFEHTASLVVKENGNEVIFGQHVDISTEGVYVFKTNLERPFLNVSE